MLKLIALRVLIYIDYAVRFDEWNLHLHTYIWVSYLLGIRGV